MSAYVFSINDYHSIKTASIKLDGITVLAGINGCGKSTISRWIYYLVNGMLVFEKTQCSYLINSLTHKITQVNRLFKTLSGDTKYNGYIEKLQNLKNDFDESNLENLFTAFTLQVENDLYSFIETANVEQKKRMAFYLRNNQTNEDYDEIISNFIKSCDDLYQTKLEKYHFAVSKHSLSDLEETIQSEYDDNFLIEEPELEMPQKFSFEEYGAPLIADKSFSVPLMLSRAIYIDTPMALSDQVDPIEESIWGRFRQLVSEPNKIKCDNINNLQFLIRDTIGGTVKLIKDDIGYSQELHYVRKDGLDIKLTDAATGIKTFAYLLRLLENGWLDKETILLIDEPEAHLHPQWIVEFARILVLLSKKIGVKIVLASHNPDMVAAIQSIADKEQMLDKTHFYLAEPVAGSSQYNFVDKGNEIGDIFESFNIAMSRIEQYGTPLI